MKLRFNLSGSQFIEFDRPEPEYLGKPLRVVHDAENKFSNTALSVQTLEGEHIGYVPEDSYKFRGHQALFEALVFDIPLGGIVTEALYKDSAGRFNKLTIEKFTDGKKGRGSFMDFEVELDLQAGDDSQTYVDPEGVEYERLTRVLSYVNWNPEDTGLSEWSVNRFKDYEDYLKYIQSCAFEGQLIHHKAQIAVYKQDLPDLVSPLPDNIVKVIKKVRKVHGTEVRVYDHDIGVAGTYDALVEVGSQRILTILDWKRSKQMQDKYYRQAAFYAHVTGAQQAMVVLARGEENNGVVFLRKDDIEKYYDEVYHAAQLVKVIKK